TRILFLSGRSADAQSVSAMLQNLPLILHHATSLQQARAELQSEEYGLIVTETRLSDANWLDVLQLARECPHEVKVIVTDGQADSRLWAEALNLGAYDLLAQPFYESEVRRILYNACSQRSNQPLMIRGD